MSGVVPARGADALREIQAPVRGKLDGVTQEMHTIVTTDLPMIEEVSGHLLRMRGKLFRPTLVLLASSVEGRSEARAVRVGAVVELMHLATLVHDDSIDHSVLRRGLPTVNSLFSHEVSVIMGDFLYARALIGLVQLQDLELVRILTEVTNQLTIGEMRQLAAVDALSFTEPAYFELIRAKTAALISAACETGALCGAPSHSERLARYGERLGMAFQVADDILDYTEDQSVTGKPSGNDLREHKVTLPLIAALPNLSSAARARIDELFTTAEPSDAQIADVVAIVTEAGGIEYARRRGEQFAQEAEEALSAVAEGPVRTALTDTISYVMDRRW